MALPLPDDVDDDDDDDDDDVANTDSQPETQSTRRATGATGATGHWSREGDADLTSAVPNTCKKKWGEEYRTDWPAVAALVPGRTNIRYRNRWRIVLDPSIVQMPGYSGAWACDKDHKLQDSVQMQGGKDWAAAATLVPGRTKRQYKNRWYNSLHCGLDLRVCEQ
jgi:hypothetical protein